MPSTPTVIIFTALALGVFIYQKFINKNGSLPLPPGPPAHWLLGNKMPESYSHRKFTEWTDEYGPVFSLRRGSNITIVIGRQDAANEIMEKQGSSLVDRPQSIAAGETLSGGMRTLLVRAGTKLRKLRRALHSSLSVNVSRTYQPMQMKNAKNHILDILADPANHQAHAKRYAASVVLSMTYGKESPTSYNDPEVIQVNQCVDALGRNMLPYLWRVDTYPILRYLPGYLSPLRRGHAEELGLFRSMMDFAKKNIATGKAPDSFAKHLLKHQAELDLSDDEIAYLAGSMFGAGADTTASAISTAVMACAVYPEAQQKVQEELDAVIGSERAPTMEDQSLLPQTQAFILETYRWRPVSVGGVAHRATKDIIWRDYRIPAGATVVGNHWAIGRDPTVFCDPENFNPQRWLHDDGTIKHDLTSKIYPFGFGRRVCPGQHVAQRSVFINMALLLWAFKMSQVPSAPIDTLAFTDVMNAHPLPFQVHFQTRLHKSVELEAIMRSYGH